MSWLRSALFNVAFFSYSTLVMLVGLPFVALGFGRTKFPWIWAKGTMLLLALLCGIRYRIDGAGYQYQGPAIVACQHQSAWETLAMWLLLPRPAFVLKRELLRIPLFGWYLQWGGCIAIDRAAGSAAIRKLVTQARIFKDQGRPIVIFPEGTRQKPGTVGKMHVGVAALYEALDVPVVPIALNSGYFWGRNAFRKKPGEIVVSVLDPLPPGLPREEFMQQLRRAIEAKSTALAPQ